MRLAQALLSFIQTDDLLLLLLVAVGVHSPQEKMLHLKFQKYNEKSKNIEEWHEKFDSFSIPVSRSSNRQKRTCQTKGRKKEGKKAATTHTHRGKDANEQAEATVQAPAEAERAIFQSSLWQFT